MAGDWMKIEHALPDKPEVMEMADILQIEADAVVGKLIRVWAWFDNHTENGHAPVTVRALLNRHTGVPDFVSAMLRVGWMTQTNDCLIMGNFDRHNGKTAKVRALGRNRKQFSRANSHATSVTDAGPEKEKRESNKNTPPEFCPCTIEQAISHAPIVRMTAEQARHWWNMRNASGWTKGSSGGGAPRRITSWQSDMATSVTWVAESLSKTEAPARANKGPDVGPRGQNFNVMDLNA